MTNSSRKSPARGPAARPPFHVDKDPLHGRIDTPSAMRGRELNLTQLDALVAIAGLFLIGYFSFGVDIYVWKKLYIPRDQFSRFDPAGSALSDQLRARADSVHRHGSVHRAALDVTFLKPADETVVSELALEWNIAGSAVQCGLKGRLVASLFVDDKPVRISGASSTIEGEGTTNAGDNYEMAFSVTLDKPYAMAYNVDGAGELREGVHEVLLLVVVEAEADAGSAPFLQLGCGPRSCSTVASRTLFYLSPSPPNDDRLTSAAEFDESKFTQLTRNKALVSPRDETVSVPSASPHSLAPGDSAGSKYNIFSKKTSNAQFDGDVDTQAEPKIETIFASRQDLSTEPVGGFYSSRHIHISAPANGATIGADQVGIEFAIYFSEWVIGEFEAGLKQTDDESERRTHRGLRCYLTFDDNAASDVTGVMLQARVLDSKAQQDRPRIFGTDKVYDGSSVLAVLELRAIAEPGWHRIKMEIVQLGADGINIVEAWDVVKILKL